MNNIARSVCDNDRRGGVASRGNNGAIGRGGGRGTGGRGNSNGAGRNGNARQEGGNCGSECQMYTRALKDWAYPVPTESEKI